jgi:hypothetical protein
MNKSMQASSVLALLLAAPVYLWATTPTTMNYQGYVTDSGAPLNGTFSVTFQLYDAAVSGTVVWSETHGSVEITMGIFDVVLGSAGTPLNPDDFNQPLWLGIAIAPDPELPLIALTSSPYSLGGHNMLDDAYDEGGAGAGRTIDADSGPVNITGSGGLTVEGAVGIGTGASPAYALDIEAAGLGNPLRITGGVPTQTFKKMILDVETGGWSVLRLFDKDQIEDFRFSTNSDANPDSWLNGPGNLGVGKFSPLEKLDVNGAIRLGTTANTNDGAIRYTGSDFEGRVAGSWRSLTTSTGGNTLDQAYDQGGPGAGATITADAGAVTINGNGGLDVADDVNVGMNLSVVQDMNVGATATFGGVVTTASDLSVNGGAEISGDLGVGVTPAEKLDVAGAIRLGTTANTNNGAIRYTGTDFEGRVAGSWMSLTTSPGGNTLDQAYDQGGPGAGATITADAGAVTIDGTGGLDVVDDVNVGGNASVGGSLVTAGNFSTNGTVTASGSATVAALTTTGDVK